MSIILFGQHPRSELLVKATRDFDRGRINHEHLAPIMTEDRIKLREIQQNWPYLSTGMFHWSDLLRPFAELIENCRPSTLTRFFETNTFWRTLELNGKFHFRDELLPSWIQKNYFPDHTFSNEDPIVFTFPFLFLFRDFSRGLTLENIETILLKTVEEIGKHQKGIIIFIEPTIGWRPLDKEEKKAAHQLLEKMKKISKIPIGLTQYFFPIEKEQDFFLNLPVDLIGIDFYCNRLETILKTLPKDKSLLAGVISIESAALEQETHLKKFFNEAASRLGREKVFLTPSGPSELLPRTVLDIKLTHIKDVLSRL